MMAASIVTTPSAFSTEPRPALNSGSSSSSATTALDHVEGAGTVCEHPAAGGRDVVPNTLTVRGGSAGSASSSHRPAPPWIISEYT